MIQIELRPEIESELTQRANSQGVALEDFITEIVEADVAAHRGNLQGGPTQDQLRAVEELLAFREKHNLTLGGLKIKDMVHEGHKY
jgi:hypothetical protein